MDIKDTLKQSDIFTGLKTDELEKVAGICQVREFSEREEIFKEGDAGQDMYILVEGRVVIDIQLKVQSEKASVHTVEKGQIFGEIALVDGSPRSATATAVQNSTLIVLSGKDLHDLEEKNPRIGYVIMRNFSRVLCSRVRKSTSNLKASLMWSL